MRRREVIGGCAAVTVVPATAPVDPHHAWLEEWRVCSDFHRLNELADLIAKTPAQTRAGYVAKLRLIREDTHEFTQPLDDIAFASVIFDQLEEFLL